MTDAAVAAVRSILGDYVSEARCREVVVAVLGACREPSEGALLVSCRHDLPAMFRPGLMGLPGDGEGTRKQMAAVAASAAQRHRKVIDALIEEVTAEAGR